MFLDIAWSEITLIGVVAIVVIGPKELPTVMRTLGRVLRRAQYMKFAFSRQFEDFMREHELHDLHQDLQKGVKSNTIFDEALADTDFHTSVNFEAKPLPPPIIRHPGESRDLPPIAAEDPGLRRDDGKGNAKADDKSSAE
jgi:sec-independent protein translocase protein TatB